MIAFIHPALSFQQSPPAVIRAADPVAPAAGAAGSSDAASSAAPTGRGATRSDNGGQLASKAVPGGTNKAPAQGAKSGSCSAPISK